MRYLSLFSGIEACSAAWEGLGWTCVGVAEIEPFPCAVLAHHYPNVPNLGSVTDITDEQIKALGPIDLVVGGSPCQDLSVAGLRKGLAGARSGLFMEQMRIFNAARYLCGARFMLWENVPGAFSVNQGRDFAVVVSEMAGAEYSVPRNRWQTTGVAIGPNGLVEWGVLDAQWFGVAQRRRRVFAVLDTGDWASRPPIFLEQHRLSGNPAPSREAREKTASTIIASTGGGGANGNRTLIPFGNVEGGEATTLSARDYKGLSCGRDGLTSAAVVSIPANAKGAVMAFAQNQRGELRASDTVGALTTGGGKPGQGYPTVAIAGDGCITPWDSQQKRIYSAEAEISPTLSGSDGGGGRYPPAIAIQTANTGANGSNISTEVTHTLDRAGAPAVVTNMAVRRLTPVECERLQGFPDNYTQIPYHNKPADNCPDGPRYKALGNSMGVPVMRYLGERLEVVNG